MLAECRAFLEYYRGVLYEGTMVEWWASFCVEEAVGHWARFFGGALRKIYQTSRKKKSFTSGCMLKPIWKNTTASWRMLISIGWF